MGYTISVDDSRKRVVFAALGRLDDADGVESAERFARAIAATPVDVEWNVVHMTGYSSAARVAWQQAIWPHRKNIRSLTLVGGTSLIRMGASVLTLALGIPCRYVGAADAGAPARH